MLPSRPIQIAILGAGIAGLSTAWYLKKRYQNEIEITIFEAQDRVGGWINTLKINEGLFELGPHSLRVKNDREILNLIEELGLSSAIIYANPQAKARYLYFQEKLEKLPQSFWEACLSPLTQKFLPALVKELFTLRTTKLDESVEEFFTRRFSKRVVERLIDPLIKGIYAGNPKTLSISACFPDLWRKEKQHRSLILSFLFSFFTQNKTSALPFFTLKQGLNYLPQILAKNLKAEIKLNSPIEQLKLDNPTLKLQTRASEYSFDRIISTLPAPSLTKLISDESLKKQLSAIKHFSIVVVHLGYKRKLTKPVGFGYLISSTEKKDILGVVFDSDIFPIQNGNSLQTRLSILLGGEDHPEMASLTKLQLIAMAKEAIATQLRLEEDPDFEECHILKDALPHYFVGYPQLIKQIKQTLQNFPKFSIFGMSFNGVAVPQLIAEAKTFSDEYNL